MRSDMRELGRSHHHRFKAVRTFKRGDQLGRRPVGLTAPLRSNFSELATDPARDLSLSSSDLTNR